MKLEVGQILREKYILSPRARKITRKNLKKKLIEQKEKSKSKKEQAKLQASIVAIEDSHPRQPRCIYFGEEVQMDDGYYNVYYQILVKYGIPYLFKTDKRTVFEYNKKGTKCMVIESFDKKLYVTVEDNIFALEEIPEVQAYSQNFDEILPTEPKKIYIPRMTHPFKRQSFEQFVEKQTQKMKAKLEKVAS